MKLATWGVIVKETEKAYLLGTTVGNAKQMEDTRTSEDWFPKSQVEILKRGNFENEMNSSLSNRIFFVSKKIYFPFDKEIFSAAGDSVDKYNTTADEIKKGESKSLLFQNTGYSWK